jgi:phenylpropionate dioxygenase-like ring-hydroxylating dioxygenase large terminal subunit
MEGRTSVVHLPRFWYVACLSSQLKGRRPLSRTMLGTPLALFRDGTGRAGAVLDRCPHRNVPLSIGRVAEGLLQCAYHGWRFDRSGTCRAVPGLCGEEPGRRARAVPAFPAVERDGFVWVWPDTDSEPAGEPFAFPAVGDPDYSTVRRTFTVTGSLHAALENTLDVPHTAFLHGGLFRGGREPVEVEVVVRAGPDRVEAEYLGEPRPPGVAGRILAPGGGVVTHFDRFIVPSIAQVEYRLPTTDGPDNHLLVTSAFTPVSDTETRLHAAVTFRLGVPHALVRAVLPPIAQMIFAQDARILARQAENVTRFGGEQFASTELDVLGQHILRLLRRAERGEPRDGAGGAPPEQRIRMRV